MQGGYFFQARGGCPLRIRSVNGTPEVRFRGYELIGGYPDFLYEVDGVKVRHRIRSAGEGEDLVQTFELTGVRGTVYYVEDAGAKGRLSSPQGRFSNGRLSVRGTGTVKFEVRLKP